jgi:hypothetical protein
MPRRLPATFADYLVVGISPALIMLLVGSLMFFLIEVFYQGQYEARLLFVMAMFVMAIVCVARISMEEGTGYAALFGLPLAVVVGIALIRFVNFSGPLAPVSALVNWGLMALVWWAAHKLTWDCTLIDDTQDASGAGLLSQMGLDQEGTTDVAAAQGQPEAAATPLDWWRSWLEADRRPHPPGMWVVYFSLAALPLYGIGGWFVPEGDLETRRRCFWLMVVYVGSGMLLLLSTSFLGLRRYLRQRHLEMPVEMAASWVGFGLAIVVAMLLLAALLPRPSPEYSIAHLVDVKSIERQASRIAFGPDGAKRSEGEPSSSAAKPQDGQAGEHPGESGSDDKAKGQSGSGDSQQGSSQQGETDSSNRQSQEASSQGSQDSSAGQPSSESSGSEKTDGRSQSKAESSSNSSEQQGQQRADSTREADESSPRDDASQADDAGQREQAAESQPQATRQSSSGMIEQLVQSLGGLLKILFYLVLGLVAAVMAWRYRAELWAAWQKLLAELRDLWARWFGSRAATASGATPPPPPSPGFSQFSDPFASGMASRWSLAELVRYTFAALEAFGREQGCPRAGGQTPLEYAAAIGRLDHNLAGDVRHLAELYSQLAFAPRVGTPLAIDPLRSLWLRMTSSRPAAYGSSGSSLTP